MTTQVAKLVSTGRSWLNDWMGEAPANMNYLYGGRLCCLNNVVARSVGLAPLLLRGARFLGYASEQAPQSVWGRGLPRPDKSGLAMTKGHGAG